jgi:ATP-dependent RNA helicase RhlE
MARFEELGIGKSILKALDEMEFIEMTPIQEQAIPIIKSGQDVLGIAQTGTGKTAAYIVPVLHKLVKAEGNDPRALILVPTRELSIQVGEEIEKITRYSNLRHAAVYGGIGWTKHAVLFENGMDIVVATPGRLWDLYKAGVFTFKKVKTLVIDEADRMLDMGFMPQLRKLFEVIPPKRQNLLFSATFSEKVEQMSHEFLTFPVRVEVAPSATTVKNVEQIFYRVPNLKTKLNLVTWVLKEEETFQRVIIFCRTKVNAEEVFRNLKRKISGEVRILHSDKAQSTRINTLESSKSGEVRVLISTDVAARGIDFKGITHVINFDLPPAYEDYVHRIGRTARGDFEGVGITLVGPADDFHLNNIEKLIRMKIEEKELPPEVEIAESTREEKQSIAREVDRQRKLADPEFKGAFHEKKFNPHKKSSRNKKKPTKHSS